MKKCKSIFAAVMVMATALTAPFSTANAEEAYKMNINIDLSAEKKAISPHIYGINQYGSENLVKTQDAAERNLPVVPYNQKNRNDFRNFCIDKYAIICYTIIKEIL